MTALLPFFSDACTISAFSLSSDNMIITRAVVFVATLVLLCPTQPAYAQGNAAFKERETKKPRDVRFDILPSLTIPTGRLSEQGKLGIGFQLRGFRALEKKQNGSNLAVGLLGSLSAHQPKIDELSSFTLLSIGPELLLLLPSPTDVTPYLSVSVGLGIINRTDDKQVNDVDYSFSEVNAMGSLGAGVRTSVKKTALIAEFRYQHFSSKRLGRTGLAGISVGVSF